MNINNPVGFIINILFLSSLCGPAQAAIKCWTNNEGVRECGSIVPPEYAQKEHQEISNQGLILETQERAKTEEELAAEARQAAIEAEQKKIAEEQARQDKILLDTFSNVDDIEMSRDGKISAIESSISLAKKRNEKIMAALDDRIKAAAAEERKGKAPNEALLEDIDSLKRQSRNNDEFIADKIKEKQTVSEAYDADIARFRRLKAASR